MFKKIRILILLLVLAFVAANSWLDKQWSTDWNDPLWVAVFPINADNSAASDRAIARLNERQLEVINQYLVKQAKRYDRPLQRAMDFHIAPEVYDLPPKRLNDLGVLRTAWWSLRLRAWARKQTRQSGVATPDIRLFLLYHDQATSPTLAHSLGLQKGMLGVVNVFASPNQAAQNRVVMAHELLHTLGASDKYDPSTNQPVYPEGFAKPNQSPRYPQRKAELMAGRIAVSAQQAVMPNNLGQTLIGPLTANEIGLTQNK